MHHEIPKEGKDVVPQGNIRFVSEGPLKHYFQRGRRLGKRIYIKRWSMIGGASLVLYGIMPNYTDYNKAMNYFKRKKYYIGVGGTSPNIIFRGKVDWEGGFISSVGR
jgi:hypothetical protein